MSGPTDLRSGYVEGFKVLELSHTKGALMSPSQGTYWYSKNLHAMCDCAYPHTPGSAEGRCGVYASHDVDVTGYWSPEHNPVLAFVRGYGTVTEGDKAWRAEHAEIRALYAPRAVNGGALYGMASVVSVGALIPAVTVFVRLLQLNNAPSWTLVTMLFALLVCVFSVFGGSFVLAHREQWMKRARGVMSAAPVPKQFHGAHVYRSAKQFAKAVGHPEIEKDLKRLYQ